MTALIIFANSAVSRPELKIMAVFSTIVCGSSVKCVMFYFSLIFALYMQSDVYVYH